jgi:hypothetical protein
MVQRLTHTRAGDGRNGPGTERLRQVIENSEVSLVDEDQTRSSRQGVRVVGDLMGEDFELLLGRLLLHVGRVEQDDEDSRPLDMAEKLVTQPLARRCALDQPGNVCQHELALVEADHTQVGFEGGEGVVGDLRCRRGHFRNEGGLAGVGKPDQRRIGEEFHLEREPLRPTVLPLLGHTRGPVRRVDEGGVAPAATPALENFDLLTVGDEVGDHGSLLVEHDRAQRNRED